MEQEKQTMKIDDWLLFFGSIIEVAINGAS